MFPEIICVGGQYTEKWLYSNVSKKYLKKHKLIEDNDSHSVTAYLSIDYYTIVTNTNI